MVVSDLLRAAIVLLLPVAAVTNIVLVYPLIFLVTSISVFFRPARVAILPRIVPEEDLLSANSALWVGETIADVIGYPLAGLFVALLGTRRPARVLGRRRDLPRVGRPARHDRRPRPVALARPTRAQPCDRASSPSSRPAGSSCAARRSCSPTRSRARSASSASASSIALTPSFVQTDVQRHRVRLAGRVRLPRDRDRRRQPHRRVRRSG